MIGVVVVCYGSEDVIETCLDSLMASTHRDLRVVISDNASPDNSVEVVRSWAKTKDVDFAEQSLQDPNPARPAQFTLLHNGANRGYAGGVNTGLRALQADPRVDLFWVLNPDSIVQPDTAAAFVRHAQTAGPFSLMGGRTFASDDEGRIQSDGGHVFYWSGICRNANFNRRLDAATLPKAADLDFISGANMVASRTFIETVGLMTEDYFLYYEEVDWAARRGDLPLTLCEDAHIVHHGGTSLGSPSVKRLASPFSNYFNFRSRRMFIKRFRPLIWPIAWCLSVLRVLRILGKGGKLEAQAAWRGLNNMAPPAGVRDRVSPEDCNRAFSGQFRL